MRIKGKITSWNDEKGFGFIRPLNGGERVFLHIKAFPNGRRRPEVDQLVTFTLSADERGRPCAVNATLSGDHLPCGGKTRGVPPPLIGAAVFFVIVAFSVLKAKIHHFVLGLYVVASLITFIIYWVDKSAAKKKAWRTRESTLYLLSLAGGWPGAIVAQQRLRHKSKKQSFQLVFWGTVFLNCAAFLWVSTPTGTAALKSLFASVV